MLTVSEIVSVLNEVFQKIGLIWVAHKEVVHNAKSGSDDVYVYLSYDDGTTSHLMTLQETIEFIQYMQSMNFANFDRPMKAEPPSKYGHLRLVWNNPNRIQ